MVVNARATNSHDTCSDVILTDGTQSARRQTKSAAAVQDSDYFTMQAVLPVRGARNRALGATSVAYNNAGNLAAGRADGAVKLRSALDGTTYFTYRYEPKRKYCFGARPVQALAWSTDGRMLAGAMPNSVHVVFTLTNARRCR